VANRKIATEVMREVARGQAHQGRRIFNGEMWVVKVLDGGWRRLWLGVRQHPTAPNDFCGKRHHASPLGGFNHQQSDIGVQGVYSSRNIYRNTTGDVEMPREARSLRKSTKQIKP
jgi:hypothetical protein